MPNSRAREAISSAEACGPAASLTGSPGKTCDMVKTIKVSPMNTGTSKINRRMMNPIMERQGAAYQQRPLQS